LDNKNLQETAAQITGTSSGARNTFGGFNAAFHVENDDRTVGLSNNDFLNNSAKLYLDLEENNGTPDRTVRSSTALGEVSVDTGRRVVTGYTNF